MEKELGVTGLQRLVLRVVGRFPSVSAGRLAKLLHVHPSTLTGVLGRLERQGKLRRRPDPRDKRRSLLGLTDAGRKLDVEAEGTIESAIQRIMEEVDLARLEAALWVLRAITNELETRNSTNSMRSPGRLRRAGTA
jgi:DNA-binding MarR family transcriptional regulator